MIVVECWPNEGILNLKFTVEFFNIFFQIIKFRSKQLKLFSDKKYQLNCLSGKECWLDYRSGEKIL